MTLADWYGRVNKTWPEGAPQFDKLTPDEAVRAGKKLYRFGMRRTFRGQVRVTSGRRYTWIRRGVMVVNPEGGWHNLIHFISHYCHMRLNPNERPHGRVHAQMEIRMIKEVLKRGWMNGKLKSEPKPPKPKPDKLTLLLARRKRWTTRARRAATALRKINRAITRLEKIARQ